MQTDLDWLEAKNVEIGTSESLGLKSFFEDLLAPAFAFRRASGVVVDRQAFLDSVKPSAARSTAIHSMTLLGHHRAVVECVVSMDVEGVKKQFHNLRVFVREPGKPWTLLAWANEAI